MTQKNSDIDLTYDTEIKLNSFIDYLIYTFKHYYFNKSIGKLIFHDQKLLSTKFPIDNNIQNKDYIVFAFSANTDFLSKVMPPLLFSKPPHFINPMIPNDFSAYNVDPLDNDFEHIFMKKFIFQNFDVFKRHLHNGDPLIDQIVSLTFLQQRDNPFFIKKLNTSLFFNLKEYPSNLLINMFIKFHEFGISDSLLFKHFFLQSNVKNILFCKEKNIFDSRLSTAIKYLNMLPENTQTKIWKKFTKTLRNNEIFAIQDLLDNISQYDIPPYIIEHLKDFSKNCSISHHVEKLSHLSNLKANLQSSEQIVITQEIPMDKIYDYYKALYTRKTFPTSKKLFRFFYNLENVDIEIRFDIELSLKIIFNISKTNLTPELEKNLKAYFQDYSLELFDEFIIRAYKSQIEDNIYNFFYNSNTKGIHQEILSNFFNKFHKLTLLEKINNNEKNSSQTIKMKSKI